MYIIIVIRKINIASLINKIRIKPMMRGQSSRRTEIMKFYIIYKIEAIASRRPTESQVKALVKEGILSKTLMKNEDIGDDWVSSLYHQINLVVEFITTSVDMGLGIPDISGDSLVAKAAYNVAKATLTNVPTRYATSQEFFRLLMEDDI